MKKLLAVVALMAVVGCSAPTKQDKCNAAQLTYTLYLAYQQAQINGGNPPSQDQILAAQAAAVILQTQCGWTPPRVKNNLYTVPWVDLNGVVVIRPPM